jgi:NAD(P)-dependent dehydrogenase (short-subunit alcohol dehydrogenase family)
MLPETRIVITGASSGLGLAFLNHYASQPNTEVIAIDNRPIQNVVGNVRFYQVDVTIEAALADVAVRFLKDVHVDRLIHCAGVRGLVPGVLQKEGVRGQPDGVAKAETWEVMDKTTMMKTLEVNTWGTFNVIRAFLPNLKIASSGSPSLPPKAIIISSRMGSQAANTSGGGYAYRASKSALNSIVKSFSIDVPEVSFLLLHPGRVETGLVEWKEEGAISPEESLKDCLKVIARVAKEGEEVISSGAFVDRFGMRIEW